MTLNLEDFKGGKFLKKFNSLSADEKCEFFYLLGQDLKTSFELVEDILRPLSASADSLKTELNKISATIGVAENLIVEQNRINFDAFSKEDRTAFEETLHQLIDLKQIVRTLSRECEKYRAIKESQAKTK